MEMDVVSASQRLARQSRRVVVVDVAVGCVENVEYVDDDLHVLRELVAAFEIHQARGRRPDGVVLNQRTRTKVETPCAADDVVQAVDRNTG